MINIGGFEISDTSKTFIIAELSANHNQDKQIAIDTIRAAKKAGADAIKFQTYTPDTLTIDCPNEYFQIGHGTLWDGKTLYSLYKEAYTPWEWHKELFEVAKQEGLICFSSPFDKTAVDLLEQLDAPAYKIASFEILDILAKFLAPLIQRRDDVLIRLLEKRIAERGFVRPVLVAGERRRDAREYLIRLEGLQVFQADPNSCERGEC